MAASRSARRAVGRAAFRRVPFLGLAGDAVSPDFYVDSLNGDDGNDGLTAVTAFATLGAARAAMADGDVLRLLGESYWTELLDISALAGSRVDVSGGVPYIDAAGEVTETWSQHDATTFPNVWNISVSHGFTNSQTRLPIWEDGQLLTRTTSVASCNTTPGSFYSPSDESLSANDPATVYVHASDSGNPNSNGSLYETARREYAVQGAFGAGGQTVVGPLTVGRQAHNDGSITLGENATMRQVLAIDGHKHNGLQESGTAQDNVFFNAQNVGGYLLVFYTASGLGKSALTNRCGFIASPSETLSSALGYYCHDNTNGHDESVVRQSWFARCGVAYLADANSNTAEGCYFLDNRSVGAPSARGSTGTSNIRCSMIRQTTAVRNTSTNCQLQTSGDGTWTFEQNVGYFPAGISFGNDPVVRSLGTQTPTIKIKNNTIACLSAAMPLFRDIQTGTRTYTITDNIMITAFSGSYGVELSPNGIVDEIDYNIYYINETTANPTFDAGSGTINFAAWQALGYDANSIVLSATDISLDGLFVSGAAGLATGDFRLRTDTGLTFGDGTPIHERAGATRHWDWASGREQDGAPTSFPTVPLSLSECEAYIIDPTGYSFYP